MSDVAIGVVETSLNEGVVRLTEDKAEIIFLVRSLIDSGKNYVVNMLTSISKLAQAQYRAEGSYPGWQPDADSPVMHLVSDTYNKLFGKIPNVMVIHAGLECGLFKSLTQTWIWFQLGQLFVCTPDERVHIASVGEYWKLLTAVLKAIPVKE
ncbi:M20/M25/M40 family metallo-hydrolase [Providencia rettgeri]|uniref:M20/M25/M40 family metallo-hydrolase n=1 Tax=Providencia rettgeri TaxID=587 RepID=A0A939NHC6_PRORE|nr:M20/M25/M40 family metallo-hydrolase [Providencia rettgeri]